MKTPLLQPTLWRTCRVLANECRIRVLAHVVQAKRTSVCQTAAMCKMPVDQASINLRWLQSRGLLGVERVGRWTFYSPQADASVRDAAALLRIMTAAIQRRDDRQKMIQALTACTHPRRLLLLQALKTGPLTAEQLARRYPFSLPAVYRHADKLLRRGAITQKAEHQPFCLVKPSNPLLADLLVLVTGPL